MNRPMAVLIAVSMLLCGCDSEESAWQKATKQNTVPSYEAFIHKYSDGEHVTSALHRIEQLSFDQAKAAGDASGLEAYLAAYPTGRFVEEAKKLLAPMVFKRIEEAGAVDAYEVFLERFPKSDLAWEAITRLRKPRYQAAMSASTLAGHLRFLRQYPDGADSNELRRLLPTLPRWKQSQELGELILTMAPKAYIQMGLTQDFDLVARPSVASGVFRGQGEMLIEDLDLAARSLVIEKPTVGEASIARVRRLLADGAVPDAVRIAGFEPAGVKEADPLTRRAAYVTTGSPGHVVPGDQKGMTLLEYCTANKLDAISDLLKAH
jgi:hypothetical protein